MAGAEDEDLGAQMTAEPLFSIVIPVYNAERFLRNCLESVRVQAVGDWECICVDDGSTDGSGTILDDYAARDRRFIVLHQANAGVSVARNRGMDMAHGDWLSFIDADDWVSPDYLSSFVAFGTKRDVNFFPPTFHWPDGETRIYDLPDLSVAEGESFSDFCHRLAFNETPRNLFGYTWNKFFRRELVVASGARFVEGLSASEDEIFTLAVCRAANSAALLHAPVYHYRLGEGGLTATDKGREIGSVLCRHYAAAAEADPRPGIVRLCMTRIYMELFWTAVDRPLSAAIGRICSFCRLHDEQRDYGRLKPRLIIRLARLPLVLGPLALVAFFSVSHIRNQRRKRLRTGVWDRRFE